jgi:PEGA domain
LKPREDEVRVGTSGVGRKIVAAVIVGALALTQTPAAWAQPRPPPRNDLAAAKKHYGEGDKKYKAGDFAGAEAEFKLANDVKSTPQAERYIGMCEDAQGRFTAAVDWYDRFLAHVPERMAAQGDEIRKREGVIKALPGKVHIASNPPGASVSVDEKPQSAPTPMDVELSPGPHTVKLTEVGRLPTQKTIDVAFASSQSVTADLDLEPPPPPPPPVVVAPPPPPPPTPITPPPPPEPRSKLPAYVTGGLAIVGAGVGTAFGILALNDKSSFDKNPTSQTADNGDSHALICDMAFGVALTFGVTSAVLFLTRDDGPAPATSSTAPGSTAAKADAKKKSGITLSAAPLVGPHSGGAGMLLKF